jgi:hypothetical protein
MHDKAKEAYEKPQVTDYGSLRDLTANGRHGGYPHNFVRRSRHRHDHKNCRKNHGGFSFS